MAEVIHIESRGRTIKDIQVLPPGHAGSGGCNGPLDQGWCLRFVFEDSTVETYYVAQLADGFVAVRDSEQFTGERIVVKPWRK